MIIHDVPQQTAEWFKIRGGKPTSSRFDCLVTGTGKPSTSLDKYAVELATEVYLDKPLDDGFAGNRFTDRGQELEPVARAWYQMENQVVVENVGFITDDLMRYGASTDGLVGDDGLVEFKNLIARRFMELKIYMARNNGNCPPGYLPQVQGELLVTERKWADLVFYHPDFESIVVRVEPDPLFQDLLLKQITVCINKRKELLNLVL